MTDAKLDRDDAGDVHDVRDVRDADGDGRDERDLQVSEVQTLRGQDDDADEGHVVGEGGLGDGGFADAVPVGQGPGSVGASDADPTEGAHPEKNDEG